VRRDEGRCPAGLVATRHSGGIGAPPGTTRSPRHELADDLGFCATGLPPSRSLLRRAKEGRPTCSPWRSRSGFASAQPGARCPNRKAGPGAEQTLHLARREAPAVSGNGHGAIGFAPFGAPSPHFDEGETVISRTRLAPRQGERMSYVTMQRTPSLPLMGRGGALS